MNDTDPDVESDPGADGRKMLAVLERIEQHLARQPDLRALLDAEAVERERVERRGKVRDALLGLLLVAVSFFGWRQYEDRRAAQHQTHCAIHAAIRGAVDVATPAGSPSRVVGDRVVARVDHVVPANCP